MALNKLAEYKFPGRKTALLQNGVDSLESQPAYIKPERMDQDMKTLSTNYQPKRK